MQKKQLMRESEVFNKYVMDNIALFCVWSFADVDIAAI